MFSGCRTLAQHLAAVLLDDRRGVALERMAEGVVGGRKNQVSPPALTIALPVPLASIQVS